jgi:uncharacterized protein
MATQIPQNPGDDIKCKIICDSDLSHLGTEFYFVKAEYLRLELNKVKNANLSLRKWNSGNVQFLKNHSYFSNSAKKLFQKIKDENIKQTEELLNLN